MDAEAHLLERLLGVEVSALLVVGHEFFLAELIKVLHDGIVGRFEFTVVGAVGDAESGVELGEQYLDGVDLRIGEILVAAEEVLEEGDVLTQSCYLLEGVGSGGIDVLNAVCPHLRF